MATGAGALMASTFPRSKERTRVFGNVGVISGLPWHWALLSVACSRRAGMAWIFYANIPVCLALALAIPASSPKLYLPKAAADPLGVVC